MDLVWIALIGVILLIAVVLAISLGRSRWQSRRDRELDVLERRVAANRRKQGPPKPPSRRTPAPVPDLVSVQEGWRYREDTDPDLGPLPGLGVQTDGTPTAPTGPRAGVQFHNFRHLLDQPTVTPTDTVPDDRTVDDTTGQDTTGDGVSGQAGETDGQLTSKS